MKLLSFLFLISFSSICLAKTFNSTFGKISYFDSGEYSKPVIIFIHGLPTSKEIFLPVIKNLTNDHRYVALDLPNFGNSEKINIPLTHKDRALVINELRQHLEIKKHILIAHDLGSSVAMDYMDLYGSYVTKLVLMSSPVFPDYKKPKIVSLLRNERLGQFLIKNFKPFLFKSSVRRGLVNKRNLELVYLLDFLDDYEGPKGETALLMNLNWGEPAKAYKNYPRIMSLISVPTLILHGEKDPYVPANDSHRMHNLIKDSKVVIYPKASHFLPLDIPKQLSKAIESFLLNP